MPVFGRQTDSPALGLKLTGDHYVGKPSATGQAYPNSAFHPSGVDKWVVGVFIDVCSMWRHLVNAYGL